MPFLSDATELLDEREQLLELDSPDAERLGDVTTRLRLAIENAESRLRRLTLADDAVLLGRLSQAEPIHPVSSDDDLVDRVAEDRRCFVLESSALPQRPATVVWVALTTGVPGAIATILDPSAPTEPAERADTAVFYSIWSVEKGLRGIRLGRSLLAAASEELRTQLPNLTTYVTLSPISGLRDWVNDSSPGSTRRESIDPHTCVSYLVSTDADNRHLDPVARFHMGNGARLFAVHPHADRSLKAQRESYGYMANYRYQPEDLVLNREQLGAGRPAVSPEVAALLAQSG